MLLQLAIDIVIPRDHDRGMLMHRGLIIDNINNYCQNVKIITMNKTAQ